MFCKGRGPAKPRCLLVLQLPAAPSIHGPGEFQVERDSPGSRCRGPDAPEARPWIAGALQQLHRQQRLLRFRRTCLSLFPLAPGGRTCLPGGTWRAPSRIIRCPPPPTSSVGGMAKALCLLSCPIVCLSLVSADEQLTRSGDLCTGLLPHLQHPTSLS